MISGDDNNPVWPNNAVMTLANAATVKIDGTDCTVLRRALRGSDPREALGIFATQWVPVDTSYETGESTLGGYRQESTLQQYLITVQAMILDMDEIKGLIRHSILAKRVRDMLLRDPEVGVALAALSVTDTYGLTERFQRRWVRTQRYVSNEISGDWVYLATFEFMIETETT